MEPPEPDPPVPEPLVPEPSVLLSLVEPLWLLALPPVGVFEASLQGCSLPVEAVPVVFLVLLSTQFSSVGMVVVVPLVLSIVVPDQVVAADGAISVPYAGRPRVAGRTPLQVQQAIEQLLAETAQKPQVIVTVTKSVSDKVTVGGDIVNGARIPLSFRGERILDVIAAAGGVKTPLYETFVRLSRGGTTVSVSMERLVADPKENIYVWPDDVITLVRIPQTFVVFGATANNAQLSFNAADVTLAQAIAKAGGLQDVRADPAGVFLFRFEPQPVAAALGVPPSPTADGRSPVLYHVNLQAADGYFLAGRFPVQNNDIVYVANAASNQLQKFLTLLGTVTQPVFSGVVVVKTIQ